jgi:hypothetical protein
MEKELVPWFKELKAKYPEDFQPTNAAARRWREEQIRQCMAELNLEAALFHQHCLLVEAVQEAAVASRNARTEAKGR